MKLSEMKTPLIVLDLDVFEKNNTDWAEMAKKGGKALWPMVKTHKSTAIARMQKQAGASGFLCGTLDECEALLDASLDPVMYAYPPAGEYNLKRCARLAKKGDIIFRLDNFEAAKGLSDALCGEKAKYTIIIDSGLHRFGVSPEACGELYKKNIGPSRP